MNWNQMLLDMGRAAAHGAAVASIIPLPGVTQLVGAIAGAAVVAGGYGIQAWQGSQTPPVPAPRDMSATIVPATR